MKKLIFLAFLFVIGVTIINIKDNALANQYSQMIRTCEATQEGRKCALVAAPIVERRND
jgi:hypothetical protein